MQLAPNCRIQLGFRVRLPSGLRIPDQFVCADFSSSQRDARRRIASSLDPQ